MARTTRFSSPASVVGIPSLGLGGKLATAGLDRPFKIFLVH
jgi:hypothetical protein|tara:strand:- start:186 stop:308 length:123 start_codon:yes stop_codon:yes gene_type:complete